MNSARHYRQQPFAPSPSLQFGSGEPSGFTSVGVASFQNLDPVAVVRELIQNSLDAARQANRPTARVRFEAHEHLLSRIPGIGQYRVAFKRAVSAHSQSNCGTLPAQASLVVNSISSRLRERICTSLFVIDNGIGLNETRMSALLGDGLSVKDVSSAGAFGNGHYVAIPASDLRYILYGGISSTGSRICAGHAILASHMNKHETKGKDGYFVLGFREGRLLDRFEFAKDEVVPNYLSEKLSWIRSGWNASSGSVVAIPAFNKFNIRGTTSLQTVIWRAAACSFFSAFAQGLLSIEMAEGNRVFTLDRDSIADVLDSVSEQKRSKRFLSGARARSAYETIRWDTNKCIVETNSGPVPIWLRRIEDGGISRIDLCRAGMWISDDIPKLRRHQFSDLSPFHCVLQIDSNSPVVHDLIRKAEGPLHNHLEARKWLSPTERASLEDALDRVAQEIRKRISSLSAERVAVADVLSVESYGIAFGGRRPSQRGAFAEMRVYRGRTRDADTSGEEGGGPAGGETEGKNERTTGRSIREGPRPAGRSLRFRAVAVPAHHGRRSWRVEIQPEEKFSGAEVRFVLDESLDASCDDSPRDTFVTLQNVLVQGRRASSSELIRARSGETVGVVLGEPKTDGVWRIDFDFEVPDDVNISSHSPVVLKTMLFELARTRGEPDGTQIEEGASIR